MDTNPTLIKDYGLLSASYSKTVIVSCLANVMVQRQLDKVAREKQNFVTLSFNGIFVFAFTYNLVWDDMVVRK